MSQQSPAGTVSALWRYAVKSMTGERITESLVTDGGLLGDRAYAVIDRTNGKVASAKFPKKWGKLIELGAAFVEPPRAGSPLPAARITWPVGDDSVTGDDDLDTRLSEALERSVTVTTARPDVVSLERLDPLADEETLLDIGSLMMAGRFSDYAALHLITTATLGTLAALGPESRFDVRRFRPNIVIDCGDETGFLENDWVGRSVCIGEEVRLRISDPTPRCAIPTLEQDGLEKDPKILRTIVEHNRCAVPLLDGELLPCAGVYAFVVQGGILRERDVVRVE